MRRLQSWLCGLVKKETLIFIDRHIEHIEIIETTTLFGFWNIKVEEREVFLPHLKIIEHGKIKVIVDAYFELHEVAEKLKGENVE